MKSNSILTQTLKLTLASAALLATTALVGAAEDRTLILLQENTGNSILNDYIDGPLEDAAVDFIDNLAEGVETVQTEATASGKYQRFVNLSDSRCTRTNLLNELIRQSRDGFQVDLVIYGHGSPERLVLHEVLLTLPSFTRFSRTLTPFVPDASVLTGGTTGNIRTPIRDAIILTGGQVTSLNLRMVYMCNCWGSTLNDDWLAAGAEVSVGSRFNNYMPEPRSIGS
ncbi:MAG: hypothetical protein ACI8T1_000169 [Verrucomicrobiales bacterium]|jgi:hypothetical protein